VCGAGWGRFNGFALPLKEEHKVTGSGAGGGGMSGQEWMNLMLLVVIGSVTLSAV
jgi:hypothetical protein